MSDDLRVRLEAEAACWEALIGGLREKRDALVSLRTADVARLTAAE
ncbi:MAG: hypothetical protein HUU15_19295, partial [Candidatus Brocadiae bacterium]|nr:hypothetical protein [Candidatus Brocadiia bacterium]